MDKHPIFDSSRNELPSDRRKNKKITDDGRMALGLETLYSDDEKTPFLSDEAVALANKIFNSGLQVPFIVRNLEDAILKAYLEQKITEAETGGLLCYMEEVLAYQTQTNNREKDYRERQHND